MFPRGKESDQLEALKAASSEGRSNVRRSRAADKCDMRDVSFCSPFLWQRPSSLDREGTPPCLSSVANAMFLYYKEKTMKTRKFSSASLCPFSGLCCSCCWCTNGCAGVFFWSNFRACFAMPAAHYKHSAAVFQTDSGCDAAIHDVFCLPVEIWIVSSQNEIQLKCVAQRMAVFSKACVGETAALVFLCLINSLCLSVQSLWKVLMLLLAVDCGD